jgi:trehalose 6-phosphate phosphatase
VDSRSPPTLRESPRDLAFFLDVDGTLLEMASRPDAVIVDWQTRDLLRALVRASEGAVAFVSGRSIATLDHLFHPIQLPSAGLHGFERRNAAGEYFRCPLPDAASLDHARAQLHALAERFPGVLLEDKQFALALHYRQVPAFEQKLLQVMEDIVRPLRASFETQRGRLVIELRPKGSTKADAVSAFMQEVPFRGRKPIFLGDDLTDECAFEWVNTAGGYSVAVGVERDSVARAHLPSVPAAREWLHSLLSPRVSVLRPAEESAESSPQ